MTYQKSILDNLITQNKKLGITTIFHNMVESRTNPSRTKQSQIETRSKTQRNSKRIAKKV